jgi:hypothetical protein
VRKLLIRCYPARWQDRYGDEFEALLEERPLGPFDVADIILGAIDARLRLRGRSDPMASGRGITMSLRIGGYAAILGGLLMGLGLAAASAPGDFVGSSGMVMFLLGILSLLVALVGLSAFQAREHPVITWTAFALPALGTIATMLGLIGMALFGDDQVVGGASSWNLWVIGLLLTFVGSALFALVTYRTGALSRRGAVVLGIGSLLPLVAVVNGVGGLVPSLDTILILGGMLGFSIGWIVLGVGAVRTIRPAVEPQPA